MDTAEAQKELLREIVRSFLAMGDEYLEVINDIELEKKTGLDLCAKTKNGLFFLVSHGTIVNVEDAKFSAVAPRDAILSMLESLIHRLQGIHAATCTLPPDSFDFIRSRTSGAT